MTRSKSNDTETTLIVNPKSGNGDHVDDVRLRAEQCGYALETTEREEHAIELAQEAIDSGTTTVVAVGGDGTLNEVVRGVLAADALETVTVGVIPAGTGNDFATHIGIPTIDAGFEVLRNGDRRRLDIGMANGYPFVNSCVAGLTAEASAETSTDMKSRFGVLAYVIATLRSLAEFQPLELTATVKDGQERETAWSGTATVGLIGNCRRFSMTGGEQANVEDGLLDVTLIEDVSSIDLVGNQVLERLFGDGGDHITRLLVSSMELSVESDEAATFSLDGEMKEFTSVSLQTERRALRMPVGDDYDPIPESA